MTGKERAKLRSIAQNLSPIYQLGKGGITENVLNGLSEALEAKELIKISVLNNADFTAKEIIDELSNKLNAEPISAIGNKIVLYKRSSREDIKHFEYNE